MKKNLWNILFCSGLVLILSQHAFAVYPPASMLDEESKEAEREESGATQSIDLRSVAEKLNLDEKRLAALIDSLAHDQNEFKNLIEGKRLSTNYSNKSKENKNGHSLR